MCVRSRALLLLAAAAAAAAASPSPACNHAEYPDDNFDGTNVRGGPVRCTSADCCAAACCARAGCTAFTLNAGHGMRDCYLKSAIAHRHNPGCISGIINGTAPPAPPAPPHPSPSPPHPSPPVSPIPAAGYLDAVKDCGCDATGATDTTLTLQACVDRAYAFTLPRVPVLLPFGTYLVSGTIMLKQRNPGGDDGINVVPGRFLPHVLMGRPLSSGPAGGGPSPRRPVIRLKASSAGFGVDVKRPAGKSRCKAVVDLGDGGVNMNMLLKGVDVDLLQPGNPNACGVYHNGAQGSTVTDVSVVAGHDTYACFFGLNGAGGLHGNVACDGARYGLYIDGAQPVPMAVGVRLAIGDAAIYALLVVFESFHPYKVSRGGI
jgi:hypothetical protein